MCGVGVEMDLDLAPRGRGIGIQYFLGSILVSVEIVLRTLLYPTRSCCAVIFLICYVFMC